MEMSRDCHYTKIAGGAVEEHQPSNRNDIPFVWEGTQRALENDLQQDTGVHVSDQTAKPNCL